MVCVRDVRGFLCQLLGIRIGGTLVKFKPFSAVMAGVASVMLFTTIIEAGWLWGLVTIAWAVILYVVFTWRVIEPSERERYDFTDHEGMDDWVLNIYNVGGERLYDSHGDFISLVNQAAFAIDHDKASTQFRIVLSRVC